MNRRSFSVKPVWDNEAGVYVADSDIIGLHVEAETLDEFRALVMELAPELIVSNHLSAAEMASKPYKDLVPAIFWLPPEKLETAA